VRLNAGVRRVEESNTVAREQIQSPQRLLRQYAHIRCEFTDMRLTDVRVPLLEAVVCPRCYVEKGSL